MKFCFKLAIVLLLYPLTSLDAKILLFTYSYNRPDFIEIQHKTFKKFLRDDYEFIVFNDATDRTLHEQINNVCAKYNIRCISIPQEIHDAVYNPSLRNCKVVNYSLNTIGFNHDDIVALFDSDLFLIKEFSIREYLDSYDLAGQDQVRDHIHYLWIGLVFMNMATMPNKKTIDFSCGFIGNTNTDSGGFTHHYLVNNPMARLKLFDEVVYLADFTCPECKKNGDACFHKRLLMKEYEFNDPLINLAYVSCNSISELYLKNTFLHYRAGTNWNYESKEYHDQKTKQIRSFFESLGITLDGFLI